MRIPPYLKAGGRIGFVAPSFGCATEPYRSAFNNALRKFDALGYRAVLGPNCYLAEGVERVSDQQLDAGEDIAVLLLTRDEVEAMLRENRQLQALMAAPMWRYLAEHPR